MASEPETNENGMPSNSPTLPENNIPQNMITAAILVGLLLIFVGIGCAIANKSPLLVSLATCVGFGIILVAFGSRARGSWAGWTAGGSGAMAIMLFLILQYFTPASSFDPIRKGQIQGDIHKTAEIRIIDEAPLYQYRDRTTKSIWFIILNRKLKTRYMRIQVDTLEKGRGREEFELRSKTSDITKRYLSDQFGGDNVIQWSFDYDNRTIKDGPDVIFEEVGHIGEGGHSSAATDHSMGKHLPLFSSALAQDLRVKKPNNPGVSKPATTSHWIALLKSDEPSARRNSRDELIAAGSAAVQPLMSELRHNPSDYRLKAGTVFVLSTMLNQDPGLAKDIKSTLKDEDFKVLVDAADDDDKTVRVRAAEFLSSLADRRSVPYTIRAARSTTDNAKAFNQISILGNTAQEFSRGEKQKIANEVSGGPAPNNSLAANHKFVRGQLKF